jgi:FeS assembly SUF system regulator
MLKISRLADYATVIMNFLVRHGDASFSASAIAEQTLIRTPTVSKLLKMLQEAGLLQSSRGAAGGYRLAKAATEINLVDIIQAIDGKPAITACSQATHDCELTQECELKTNWQYINRVVCDVLKNISLQDMQQSLQEQPLHFHQTPKQAISLEQTDAK